MAPADGEGQQVDYDRIISLFTGSNSSTLYERHISAIDRICKGNPNGVAIRDLPKVQQILTLTLQLIRNGLREFIEPAISLLRALSRPYMKRTATDEFKMLNNIASILGAIGEIFAPSFPREMQDTAAELLKAFATAHGNRPGILELAATANSNALDNGSGPRQYHTNQELIARSGVINAVMRGLAYAIIANDQAAMYTLASVLLSFSYLPSNCVHLLEAGVLACLPHLLAVDFRHQLAPVSVELLWNLADMVPSETKAKLAKPQPMLTRLVNFVARQPETQADEGAGSRPPSQGNGNSALEDGRQDGTRQNGGAGAQDTNAEPSMEMSDAERQAESSNAGGEPDAAAAAGEYDDMEDVAPALASALVALFRSALLHGFSQSDKELRNDILVVLNLLLDTPNGFSGHCLAHGLFDAVLAVGVSPELGDGSPHARAPIALTTEELDLELRHLCWRAAAIGCELEADARALAAGAGFVGVLLLHVDLGAESAPSIRRWNADQLAHLRAAALSRLHQVAPLCPEQFLGAGGVGVLLAFLSSPASNASSHMEAALRHLHKLCTSVPSMCEELGARGAVRVLIDLIQLPSDGTPRPEGGVRHLSLMLLSTMCSAPITSTAAASSAAAEGEAGEGTSSPMASAALSAALSTGTLTPLNPNLRRFRKEGGIPMLMAQLERVHRADPTLPSPFAVAVFDAVWCCVVPDRKNTAHLLVAEGMDALLNVLERGNKSHRPIILSLVADLLENPRTHNFFHEWRSDINKQTAGHMLITFWQEEDALRGMTVNGLLTNTGRPLTGLAKRTKWVPNESLVYGNLAPERKDELKIMQEACAGEQLLEKLYAVFKLLGMDTLSYLSTQDQSVLCMVEKYVKFRQGEVWRQIRDEFEEEGLRPTSPDRERLASGIEFSEHLARAVHDAQGVILGRYAANIQQQETQYLENMKAQKKLEQEMRFYQKDRSQLTMAELREAKQKKEAMLKNSIQSFAFQGGVDEDEEPAGVGSKLSSSTPKLVVGGRH